MSDTCDHCGGRVGQYSHGCPGCGAPQCCQLCCTGNHEALRADHERLTAWIDDLQSGMYVNCVYCGHRYGPGETTPVSMSDALKAHVEQCPQHPMSALRAENEQLRTSEREGWRHADELEQERKRPNDGSSAPIGSPTEPHVRKMS